MPLKDTRETVQDEVKVCYWDVCADMYLDGQCSLEEAISAYHRYMGDLAVQAAQEAAD